MRSRMTLMVGLLAILLVLSAVTATAQPNCRLVNAHLSDYAVFTEQEDCGALPAPCRTAAVVGTLGGSWTAYNAGYGFEFPAFGDTSVWRAESIFETNHGEINTMMVGINFWPTLEAADDYFNSEIHVITGGTGRYAGATGYILLHLSFFGGVGEATGQICWPEE
jgi:hypothetical protein